MSIRYARPEILDALPNGRFAVLEASAGTGKTFTLEHLVVDRLIRGASIDQVLVVTFTEKATREMSRRVRETLGRIVRARPDDASVDPSSGPAWTIDDATRTRLLNAWVGFERCPISTIHGFCQRVLTDHAFRSHRPFGHELVEPRRAFGAAFRDELRVLLAEDSPERRVLMGVLDALDVDALESLLFEWQQQRGHVRPEWDEDRFRTALTELGDARLIDIIKHEVRRSDVAARLCKEAEALQRIAEDFRKRRDVLEALVAVDRWGRRQVVQNETARLWVPARLAAVPLALAPVMNLLEVAPPLFGILVHRLLPRVVRRLEATKAERFQLDFDDMLQLVNQALHEPGGETLVHALRAQYPHALVDEFQDTDDIQWSIFRRLYVDPGSTGTLTLIGDPKQAIYGFRNADVHTYYEARRALVGDQAVPLSTCWRATKRLVQSYNQIFEEDEDGFFRGTVRYEHPVTAADRTRRLVDSEGNDAAAVALWQFGGREKPRAPDVRRALALRIAQEARRIREGALALVEGGSTKPIRYSDMHVLVRSAREAERIAEVMEEQGVPYAFFKQEGLFNTKEASDLRDVMRAVADPNDRAARLRAWLTDFFDVGLSRVDACRQLDVRHPLVAQLFSWHRRAEQREPGLLRSLLVESGLVRRLLHRARGGRALTNYEHLVEILMEERGAGARIQEMVSLLEAFIEGRAQPVRGGSVQRHVGQGDAVQLLTMHKSKGLEASVVFLAGGFTRGGNTSAYQPLVAYRGEEQTREREIWLPPLPAEAQQRVTAAARHEDERLFYVAITRAKGRVYLPYFGAPPVQHHSELAGRQRYGPLQGGYRLLDERLETLVLRGYVDDDRVSYECVPLELEGEAPQMEPRTRRGAQSRSVDSPDFDRLRNAHQGFELTSYTRIKAQTEGRADYVPMPSMDEARSEEFAGEDAGPDPLEVTERERDTIELPGGATTGIFLHEVIEHLDFAQLEGDDFADWYEQHEPLVLQCARRQGMDTAFVADAAALVWHALRAPVQLGDVELPHGFSAIRSSMAEMELFYPIPEPNHPPLGQWGAHPIQRGIIRGIVDLVFEHEGRTYFLDWKSDRVEVDQGRLVQHVQANYGLQARLYTLGVVRMLGVTDEAMYEARFGGLVYAFLRVMGPSRGVVFDRPTWEEVVGWDQELRHADRPFGYTIGSLTAPAKG